MLAWGRGCCCSTCSKKQKLPPSSQLRACGGTQRAWWIPPHVAVLVKFARRCVCVLSFHRLSPLALDDGRAWPSAPRLLCAASACVRQRLLLLLLGACRHLRRASMVHVHGARHSTGLVAGGGDERVAVAHEPTTLCGAVGRCCPAAALRVGPTGWTHAHYLIRRAGCASCCCCRTTGAVREGCQPLPCLVRLALDGGSGRLKRRQGQDLHPWRCS